MDPLAVGQAGSTIVLGKHSGKAALRQAFERAGVDVDEADVVRALDRLKELADQGITVSDDEVINLIGVNT
jgi:2-isopropylmalate synthase